ncbi:MAG: hypothetical protein P4L16_08575 [Chlamydiales bacterium]|nr:hypothetical protein [Chlamydiales bacterium]
MSSVNPDNVGALFYRQGFHGKQEILFEETKDGLVPITADNVPKGQHPSEVAASVLGPRNYETLLKTIQDFRGRVVKLENKPSRSVVYLAPLPVGVEWSSSTRKTKWIPLDQVRTMITTARNGTPAAFTTTDKLAPSFVNTASLLLGDAKYNPLQEMSRGATSGVVTRTADHEIVCKSKHEAPEGAFYPLVDTKSNEVVINGEKFTFEYTMGGQPVSLESMPPNKRREFLLAVQAAAQKSAEGSSETVQKITFSFKDSKIHEFKVYGEDLKDPIKIEDVSSTKFEGIRDNLNRLHSVVLQTIVMPLFLPKNKIQGIPRTTGEQTCWFGSSMHLMARSLGNKLEVLKKDTTAHKALSPSQKTLLEQLLKFKRHVSGEDNTPIKEEDVTEFQAMCKNFAVDTGDNPLKEWDFTKQNDPDDFVLQVLNALFPGEDHSKSINGSIKGAPPDNNTPKSIETLVNESRLSDLDEVARSAYNTAADIKDGYEENSPKELRVMIQRSSDGLTKNNNPIAIEPITTVYGIKYELVAVVEHEGDATGGHYIAYSYSSSNNAWYKCNDADVSLEKDVSALMNRLSTTATNLVYRRLP